MSWWIGTLFGPLANLVDAVWVEADEESEAAQEIVSWFDSEDGRTVLGDDLTEIDKVFVVPADNYVVYDVGLSITGRSRLQCCGGNAPFTEHSGHCPLNRAEVE